MSNKSEKFLQIFPMAFDVDKLPPVVNSIIDGYRAPHYALGWLIPIDEATPLFGVIPEDRRPLNYYNTVALAERWRNVKEKDLNFGRPIAIIWDHDTPAEDQKETYLMLHIGINSSQAALARVAEHKEVLIAKSMQAIGFPSKKRAQLKWHQV
ncbi:hypothetical protein F5876DRAFT_70026 [Lentinula aff. lateritia]|uniref:Uncharacterized protein n=1 Tax=Lentinula aff. lateritia TaxID=2804960 RepID=A0ACC1TKD6_9AGAR|nr:hypothetical protein F5876DRAFT_70026 [Lentinula aff. lateritia]